MPFVGTYASPVPGIVLFCMLEDKFCMPNVTMMPHSLLHANLLSVLGIQQFPFVCQMCQTFTVLFIVLLRFRNQ